VRAYGDGRFVRRHMPRLARLLSFDAPTVPPQYGHGCPAAQRGAAAIAFVFRPARVRNRPKRLSCRRALQRCRPRCCIGDDGDHPPSGVSLPVARTVATGTRATKRERRRSTRISLGSGHICSPSRSIQRDPLSNSSLTAQSEHTHPLKPPALPGDTCLRGPSAKPCSTLVSPSVSRLT